MNKSVDVLYQLATSDGTKDQTIGNKVLEMLETIIDLDLLNKAFEVYTHGIWDNGVPEDNVQLHYEAVDKGYKKVAIVDGKETFEGKLFLVLSVLVLLDQENFLDHTSRLVTGQLLSLTKALDPENATKIHLSKVLLAKQVFMPVFPLDAREELEELKKRIYSDEEQEQEKEQE